MAHAGVIGRRSRARKNSIHHSQAKSAVAAKKAARVGAQSDIDHLWQQFHKTRDDACRNSLIEHYRYLVRYTAERVHTKLPDKVEVDDLVSAGNFGLMDAIDAFDPRRGVKFETYCSPRIRGSILDELRSMDWVPRLVRARAHQLSRATQSLEAHLGRKPRKEELAHELAMGIEEFTRLQQDADAVGMVSLNSQFGEEDSEKDIREIDIVRDNKSEAPPVEAQKRDLKELLTRGLTRAERLIIILYYYEEMTMKEIGATLDLSESRVSQMHSSILARLKAQLDTRKREFLVGSNAALPSS
jgi:RNA polymerase sigma factor for flagellar operon FliA